MINVKDKVFAALGDIDGLGYCSDLYPGANADFPAIQYTEEANNVLSATDSGEGRPVEQIAYLRYRVDIWDKGSTSQMAIAVDDALSPLGLVRIECADVPDPTGLRHKQMRYECQIDVNDEMTYWMNNQ